MGYRILHFKLVLGLLVKIDFLVHEQVHHFMILDELIKTNLLRFFEGCPKLIGFGKETKIV